MEQRHYMCQWCKIDFIDKWHKERKYCGFRCKAFAINALRRSKNGGRYKTSRGYIAMYMPEHPDAGKDGSIMEHRLVMERHLGRRLDNNETVHHINGIIDDNDIENLQLMIKKEHDGMNKPKKPIEVSCPQCRTRLKISLQNQSRHRKVEVII